MEKALQTIDWDAAVPKGDRSLPSEVREPNTLICLMGEQTHPSVILAGKLERSLKKVVLMGTKDVEALMAHAGAAITSLSGGIDVVLDPSLSPYDWQETESVVGRWVEHNKGAVLDLTGGTKPMVIGAYRAGTAAGLTLVYVDTRGQKIRPLGEVPCAISEPGVFPDIRADVLLRARGFTATYRDHHPPLGDHHRGLATGIFAEPTVWRDWLSAKGQGSCDTQKSIVLLPSDHKAMKFLSLLTQNGFGECRECEVYFYSPDDYRLLTSGFWLEHYVAEAAKQAGAPEVLLNLKCFVASDTGAEPAPPVPVGHDYEFDVVLTKRATLYFISCKSGKIEWEDIESFANSMRGLGGTFAKGALVSVQTVTGRLFDKAQRNDILVWDADKLNNLTEYIRAWLA